LECLQNLIYFGSPIGGVSLAALGLLIARIWKPLPMTKWQIALAALGSTFLGFVFTWIGTYCISLIRVTGVIYREQELKIDELNQRLTIEEAQRNPKLSEQAIELLKAGTGARGSGPHKIRVVQLEQTTFSES
jgi:hypothetical protein